MTAQQVERAKPSRDWLAAAVAFACGVIALQRCVPLPDPLWVQWLPLLIGLIGIRHRSRIAAWAGCGFLWACVAAHVELAQQLPEALTGVDLVVTGRVLEPPVQRGHRVTFEFEVMHAHLPRKADCVAPRARARAAHCIAGRVRLSWYDTAPALRAGERWRLTARLRPVRGLANPGGFDAQQAALARRLRAIGYVRDYPAARRLDRAPRVSLAALRQRLADWIDTLATTAETKAIVKSLTIGVRDDISRTQWDTLRATGTNHLLAISGLHISLVAGMVFLALRALWSRAGLASLWMPAPQVAAIGAIAAALCYAALAGFSVPTQRACIMLSVIMLAAISRRALARSSAFGLALTAVLVHDPFCVLGAGVWLSFAAVAAILYTCTERGRMPGRAPGGRMIAACVAAGRLQFALAIALLPLSVLFFSQSPIIGPLANLLAVPWTSIAVVPPLLIGIALSPVSPALAELAMALGCAAIELLWLALEQLEGLHLVYEVTSRPTIAGALAGAVGVLLLLSPRGVPSRHIGCAWLAPALFWPAAQPGESELWVTVLDVGQGLSVVMHAQGATTVYDAGPAFAGGFDAGRDVVVPFLRGQGVRRLDTLVISHGDMDHAGGAAAIGREMAPRTTLSSASSSGGRRLRCLAGTAWWMGEYRLEVLHPERVSAGHYDNDDSCVLRVVGPGGRALFVGDVESAGETALVRRHGEALRADVLIVPHHGSRTSSTPAFLDAVAPRLAVVSNGHRNRFGFPHPEVVQRYAQRRISLLETAEHGAITIILSRSKGARVVRLERSSQRRYWHR